MKVFVKTDENGKVIESVIANVQDFELIELSDEESENLSAQFDTFVKGGKVTKQEKGEAAEMFEKRKLEAEATIKKLEEESNANQEPVSENEVSEAETEIQK